jgi:hypothetical protein
VRPYPVVCPYCGNAWQSRSESGRTQCRHPNCRRRIYVPLSVRLAASEDENVVPEPIDKEPAMPPEAVGPMAHRISPPGRPTARESRPPEDGITYIEAAAKVVELFAPMVLGRKEQPGPASSTTMHPASVSFSPLPDHLNPSPGQLNPSIAISRHQTGRPPYVLETTCGCAFGWSTPEGPTKVRCPDHDWVPVRSMASSDGRAGPFATPLEAA